jgi:hypothetical protein
MSLVAIAALRSIAQLNVRFMNQRRWLQRVVSTLRTQMPRGYAMQFVIKAQPQFIHGGGIASLHAIKQTLNRLGHEI